MTALKGVVSNVIIKHGFRLDKYSIEYGRFCFRSGLAHAPDLPNFWGQVAIARRPKFAALAACNAGAVPPPARKQVGIISLHQAGLKLPRSLCKCIADVVFFLALDITRRTLIALQQWPS